MTALVRTAGALLVGLVALPVYRLLHGREVGLMGSDILLVTEQDRSLMLIGAPIALIAGLIVARIAGWDRVDAFAGRISRALAAFPLKRFALAVGALAAAYAAGFSLLILDGKPNLIDSMAQLLHARFVAAGHLAGPAQWNEFWHMQNSIVTERGWVSQYPPGHVLLLAAGLRAGAVWAVGPIMCGMAAFFTALAAERLLPEHRGVARVGALLAGVSPFFIAHAGAYMNHVSAAATGAAAVYFAVRARDSVRLVWPVLAGVATGAAFTIRPLAAIATAATVAVVFATAQHPGDRLRRWTRASLAATIGALPFAGAIAAYNAHFFGSALRFGYEAAWGPATGLGFHRDPWGNAYGLMEAAGFTSSDLTALSLHLLGTPIPVVLVAGLFLLLARRFTSGEGIIALWALLPVAANALYWHHGMFMGPRMLNEAAPAWALFAVVSAAGLVRQIPLSWEARGYSLRGGLAAAFMLAGATGILYLGPDRLRQYGGSWMASTRIVLPPGVNGSLVFVHGGWSSRIGMRLAARGLSLDSLETALRLNATCDVHHFAAAYPAAASTAGARPLDFTLRSGELRPRIQISQGNYIRLHAGDRLTPECISEAASDTAGIVDVAPLTWQGDVPGAPATGQMIVRDMGPEANAALIAAHRERVPLMFMRRADDAPPVLVPYDSAMQILWRAVPARPTGP